jgi:ABC-type cobalamin/Fe3+-siderophores transport system ATPase subunit
MEFESEEPAGDLLDQVFTQGYLEQKDHGFLTEVQTVFELEALRGRPTRALSKGEMQRLIMAFAVLYGSRVVVMDEPVFALEDRQKHRALEFLSTYARASNTTFLYCAHELDLHRTFSDHVVLFSKDAPPRLGTPDEVLSRGSLEAAYQVPYPLLYQKEELHRQMLNRTEIPRSPGS